MTPIDLHLPVPARSRRRGNIADCDPGLTVQPAPPPLSLSLFHSPTVHAAPSTDHRAHRRVETVDTYAIAAPGLRPCEEFKRELGVGGADVADVVDAACEALGISDTKGLSLMEKTQKCWTSI